jgi:hypothetical protein
VAMPDARGVVSRLRHALWSRPLHDDARHHVRRMQPTDVFSDSRLMDGGDRERRGISPQCDAEVCSSRLLVWKEGSSLIGG